MYSSINAEADIFAVLAGILVAYSFIVLIIAGIMIASMWVMFTKAGKPGWAAIIPIYNIVVLFQIIGLSPWLLLLSVVPIINGIAGLVFSILIASRLAKAFGKDVGYAFGIFFLPMIFYPILAFSKAEYVGVDKE